MSLLVWLAISFSKSPVAKAVDAAALACSIRKSSGTWGFGVLTTNYGL